MEPIDIEQNQKKGFKILHRCQKCKKMMWNMVSEDDDLYLVTQLIKHHNERTKKLERKNPEGKKKRRGKSWNSR